VISTQLSHIRRINGPVLITGHTGFKGTWMTLLLEYLGLEVVGLSLKPEPGSLFERLGRQSVINEKFVDIRDSVAVSEFINQTKPVLILHFAAQSLVLESYKDPRYTFEVNVNGTINVLESAFAGGFTKTVLTTTTDKVYANTGSQSRFQESDSLGGSDPYSASKVAVENVIYAWRKISTSQGGPKFLTARSGNVIGGGDYSRDRLFPDIIRAIESNSELVIRSASSTRPWQHVLDSLHGYLMMINKSLKEDAPEILNFGPLDESLTVKQVVEIAASVWSNDIAIRFAESTSKFESDFLGIDSELAKISLGWQSKYTQKEAVAKTIDWWKQVLNESISPKTACDKEITDFMNSQNQVNEIKKHEK
jgi:CDP-glucose 4,6-dehydratase